MHEIKIAVRAARDEVAGAGAVHVEAALSDEWTVVEEITDHLEDVGAFGFGTDEHSRAWVVESPGGELVTIRRLGSTSSTADWYAAFEQLPVTSSEEHGHEHEHE